MRAALREPRRWVLAGVTSLLAACAAAPADDGLEFVLAPGAVLDEDALRTAAAHEIAAFHRGGHDEADLADAADTMERRLRIEGFPAARVRHEIADGAHGGPSSAGPSGAPSPVARLIVAEGPRAVLGDVTFPGASALRPEVLRHAFGAAGSPLRVQRIESAVTSVRARYHAEGYVDAQTGPAVLRWTDDRSRADVEVPVTEGRKWTISRVRVSGVRDASLVRTILADLALEGRPFTPRSAPVAAARVRALLASLGRLESRATGTEVRDTATAEAAIELTVEPGPVARTGEVRISGLDRTDPDFARGLVSANEGEILTRDQIDASSQALSDTGVFRSVVVEPRRPGGAPAAGGREDSGEDVVTDLEAAVQEIDARTVDFELGFGSYELVRGRVRYLDENFLGRARTFETDVTASYRGVSVGARYDDRYLIGSGIVFSLAASGGVHEEPEFVTNRAEFEASLARAVGEHSHVDGGYRLRATRATDVDGAVAGAEESGWTRAGGLFARFEDDRTDDPYFPRRGTKSGLEAFWSAPGVGADLHFLELSGSVAQFVPLGEVTVLVFAVRGTTREVLDASPTLPIQERLFLGGEDSVRSFGQGELAPLNAAGHAAGGLTAAEFHVELRRRLVGDLDGALFWDVGWVGRRSFDFEGPPGVGIGAGLRYRLPVGPIRVDLAWNPGDLRAANSRWAVHVSFGFAF